MVVLTRLSSVWPKLALFSAGVFFHGAADHVMVATIGRAPDVQNWSSVGARVWLLAALDFVIAVALYVAHRRLDAVREQGASPPSTA